MTARSDIEHEVSQRAGQRCEYCRMHQALQGATFHVEHIIPRSRNGSSHLDNLAWACPGCNLHKSDRVEVRLVDTGEVVRLFNPRVDSWNETLRLGWVMSSVGEQPSDVQLSRCCA